MTQREGSGQWTAADVGDQQGRIAVITGATSGLGLETARVLARHGATVVLAGRDLGKLAAAAEQVRAPEAKAGRLRPGQLRPGQLRPGQLRPGSPGPGTPASRPRS